MWQGSISVPGKYIYFFSGTGLTLVLCLFSAGLFIRVFAFLSHMGKSGQIVGNPGTEHRLHPLKMTLKMTGAACLPFHRAWFKKPVYTLVRYIFHVCLFIVPIWESGHVILLKAKFGWYWTTLPAAASETMTLLVIGIGLFFFARRLGKPQIRVLSSKRDFVIILLTIAPFITGYFYANGTLNHIPFIGDMMLLLHVLTGQVMLLMVVFLFVRTGLLDSTCVGCASCAVNCPTGTLEAKDAGRLRSFFYSHYQCICCGACVAVCPEGAARLRHTVSLPHFFSFFKKQKIREKELTRCEGCNDLFAPGRQIEKIQALIKSKGMELPRTLNYCSRCKKLFSNQMPV